MLYVGDYMCIPNKSDITVLNLSGLVEGYQRINLIPQKGSGLDFVDDANFDLAYFNYIFSNDAAFMELMKIIIPLYYGIDVFILVTRDEYFDKITESLMKVIQQRYGYNHMIINDPFDYPDDFDDVNQDEGFSISGLACLDQDKERYAIIIDRMTH